MGEDLRVAGVGGLVAEDDRSPHRSALDLVHQAELHLAVALAAELRRKVSRPQLLLFHFVLQRPDRAHEAAVVGLQDLERIDLFAHQGAHPFEFGFELRLGRKIPGHIRLT